MRSRFRLPVALFLASLFCFLLPTGCGGGGASAPVAPQVPKPVVQSISPSTLTANPTGAVQITLTGSGFVASSQVQVGGTAISTTFVSSTTLQASIPATLLTASGKLVLTVVNGSVSSDPTAPGATLTVTAPPPVPNPMPVISMITPSAAVSGGPGMTVTVAGKGFVATTSVSVNGTARPTTYVSATQVTFALTATDLATSGNLSIVLSNPAPGGGSSAASAFPVNNPMPTLSTLLPASVTAGSTPFTLDVKGTGFVTGSTVYWGSTALASTPVSSTEITAVVPASLIVINTATSVTVVSPAPGGGQSSGATFTVLDPMPALTGISPHAVALNQSTATITLTGTGFAANSVAQWNGAARPTTILNSTALQVLLSTADLAVAGTGKLTVSSPAPGGGTTAAIALPVTDLPIPAITGADLSLPPQPGTACPQLQIHVTGTNFFNSNFTTLTVNGQALRGAVGPTDILASLPAGFSSTTDIVAMVSNSLGGTPIPSDPFTVAAPASPLLALCATPSPATIYPGSSFFLTFSTSQINTSSVPAITGWTLPPGITSTATLPLTVPSPQGARVLFNAAASLAPGSSSLPVTATAGAVTSSSQVSLMATAAAPPNFFIQNPFVGELAVAPGGSGSLTFSTTVNAFNNTDYAIALTASGLPSGITASFNPSSILPGEGFGLTINAAANAPLAQNVTVTVTGTPQAAVTSASATFLLDVAPEPGSSPNNRTAFVSTAGTPYAAVYDLVHKLIFASNPSWNRVDVVSSQTRAVVRSIPVRGPTAIDLSQDGTTVWIGTDSQQVYALNTSTFGLVHYALPGLPNPNAGPANPGPIYWVDSNLLALSDGTLFLSITPNLGSGITYNAIWSPATNALTALQSDFYAAMRSGDGRIVYLATVNSSYCSTSVYDVATRTTANLPNLSEVCSFSGVNRDGSRLLATANGRTGLYDGSLNPIGYLPGNIASVVYDDYGGFAFSRDEATLYELGTSTGRGQLVATFDVPSLTLKGVAPALPTLALGAATASTTSVIGVDDTGVLMAVGTYGICFNDSTYFQTYAANTPGQASPVTLTPRAGPLSGGTVSTPYGFFGLTPDVWYGQNRGTANVDATNTLTITSPPGDAPGPVDLKYLYPDGNQVFSPQAFSYSVYPQYSVLSGASPSGGVPGRIAGYGMPADGTGGSLTVGGQAATITTQVTQYPPYTGEPFPSTFLDYTIPAGNPGYADLQITTPIGSGTLPKAVFYAKSVTDYPSSDTFTDVLYDAGRQQVYLSGTDHIDVFSTATKQWLTPLKPASLGAHSQFRGLALSVDGTQLLAANFLDSSLAVINPDLPAQTFAIAIPPASSSGATCAAGPFSVSALAGSQAFVTTGLPPGIGGCPQYNTLYRADLQAHTLAGLPTVPSYACGIFSGSPVGTTKSSTDGSRVLIGVYGGGTCLYSSANQTFTLGHLGLNYYGISLAGDGNLLAVGNSIGDPTGDITGSLARPLVLNSSSTVTPYPFNNYPPNTLYNPTLNASGSLYFWAYPHWIDIFDVPTGTLRLRFSLAETVQNVETPLATDAGGRLVFLITDAGLTVVDMGSAPLSIGHLSSTFGTAGAQIQVRGSGFAAGLTATIGGQSATLTVTDENTMTLTVPSLPSGPQDLKIANPDGTSYTLVSAIQAP